MGVTLITKVIYSLETKDSYAKLIQPENHKQIIIIIAINAAGSVLSLQIILVEKKHQSQQYSAILKEYRISISENSQINDDLGFKQL